MTHDFLKRIELAIDSSFEDAQDFLNYQADKINWETFKLKCLQRHSKFNDGNISTDYAEWIEGQKSNTLSNSSSGSFFTALVDVDSIFDEFALTEEALRIGYNYYLSKRKLLK